MIGSVVADINTVLDIAATANSFLCACHVLSALEDKTHASQEASKSR